MKAKFKLKLNKKAMQEFLLDNVEKILFGGVVLCALVMLYEAMTLKGYDKVPAQLNDSCKLAEEHVQQTSVDPPPEWLSWTKLVEYGKIIAATQYPVDPDRYAGTKQYIKPILPHLKLRPQPELLAAEKLRGTAGRGTFAVKALAAGRAGGGEARRGMRYAVFTALVPVEKQSEAFRSAFGGAALQDPRVDEHPNYLGFFVQRAEVLPNNQSGDINWETSGTTMGSAPEMRKATEQWSKTADEIVDPRFLTGQSSEQPSRGGRGSERMTLSRLVFPLGPLLGRSWGAEVVHEPEISTAQAKDDRPGAGHSGDPAADTPPPDASGPFGDAAPATAKTKTVTVPDDDKNKPVEYLLLRFFDFSVEPGTLYRYRVALLLDNPNHGKESQFLANSDLSKKPWITTPWSEPSNVIGVDEDVRVLVKGVKMPHGASGDPEATVEIMKWLPDSGITAHHEFDKILRGQLLDYPGMKFDTRPPESHATSHATGRGRPSVRTPASNSSTISVDYTTGATVIDITGGGEGQANEVLLLDQQGNLFVHNDIEDDDYFLQWKAAQDAAGGAPNGGQPVAPPPNQGGGVSIFDGSPPAKPARKSPH